ncbi:MAG: CsgG/HfaB family protein [Fidelibacterota bacterium]
MLLGQATHVPTVAVLDFEARGIPSYEAETLTERLRSEIATTDAVQLIERKMLEKILAEQGLQQSGCTTAECAAEVGQLLGAEYMISGAIGKLGKSYTVDAKMFSVTTGAMERTKSISYDGAIDGLLIEMEILAWEIVGLKAPQRLLLKRQGGESKEKPTVAVLDFEARGISLLEAQTLTDRFSSEISNTQAATLVQRRAMNEILTEQGMKTGDCTSDECAAEIGALLGVKYMINGAIGKVGDTYTIDAKMFDVASGAAVRTKTKTYTGAVDGLITEIELLAWEIMDLQPPKSLYKKRRGGPPTAAMTPKGKTRFGALVRSTFIPGMGQFYSNRRLWGWLWLTTEVAAGTLAYLEYSNYQTAYDDYNSLMTDYHNATDPQQIADLRTKATTTHQDMIAANDQLTTLLYAVGGIWVTNMVHALLTGPKQVSSLNTPAMELAYDQTLKQPQVKVSFAF